MDMDETTTSKIHELLNLLVSQDYQSIVNKGWIGRLTPMELERSISDYGRTLTDPPDNFMEFVDVCKLNDGSGWAVDVPLWTREEDRSDLTLSLIINISGDVKISDLHVL